MDPITLQELLDAFADGGSDAVRTLLNSGREHNLQDLRGAAADAFQGLYGQETRTAADVEQMGVLADVIDVVREQETTAAEAAAEVARQADELAARALGTTPDAPAADGEPAGEEAAAEADAGETPPADAPVLEGEVLPAVTASTPPRRPRVDLAALARRAPVVQPPAQRQPEEAESPRATILAAADVPGFAAGQTLDLQGLADATLARFSAMPTAPSGREGTAGQRIQQQIAIIRKPTNPALVASGQDDQAVIDFAADESRLEGNSLVAAGGWCAPSEVWYDLCPGLEGGAGLISLPTVTAMRGGVRWTQGPQFCDFYSGIRTAGQWAMTEAQDIAGFQKPCFEIPCPDFEECRLDAYGLCLTAGILQNRGYPEYVRRWIDGALAAHAHWINAIKIQRMIAQATPVTANTGGTTLGATTSILSSLELHVENYRYRYRMDPNRSLEAIFPYWLRGVVRSDLSKRSGVPFESVSDAQINGWFRERGVNPQWVYDWQDALCGTNDAAPATEIGGPSQAVTAWPDQVQVLLYPAGTFVELSQDVITLENVYDSTMFTRNRYHALFTEEAFCIINRCYEALLLTVDICANGVTAGTAVPACPVA